MCDCVFTEHPVDRVREAEVRAEDGGLYLDDREQLVVQKKESKFTLNTVRTVDGLEQKWTDSEKEGEGLMWRVNCRRE